MYTYIETARGQKTRGYILYSDSNGFPIIVSTPIGIMRRGPDGMYHHIPCPEWNTPNEHFFNPWQT